MVQKPWPPMAVLDCQRNCVVTIAPIGGSVFVRNAASAPLDPAIVAINEVDV